MGGTPSLNYFDDLQMRRLLPVKQTQLSRNHRNARMIYLILFLYSSIFKHSYKKIMSKSVQEETLTHQSHSLSHELVESRYSLAPRS
jgi:hypothetical protein